MKYALALSGGGFKGAYELGAIEALQQAGIVPSMVAGTSVGSLNAVMVAQNKLPVLANYWDQVEANGYSEIWDSWLVKEVAGSLAPKIGGLLEVGLLGKAKHLRGLGTLRPLQEKLLADVRKEDFVMPIVVGLTSLADGSYHSIDLMRCKTNEDAVRAVLASATIPMIWEPIPYLDTIDGGYAQLVDGGVQSITPIKECIDFISVQPYVDNWQLIVVTCSTDAMDAHPNAYNLLGIAGRSLELLLNHIYMSDLSRFKLINDLVACAGGSRLGKYRNVPAIIIEPSQNLGSTLDSQSKTIRFRRDLGKHDVQAILSK